MKKKKTLLLAALAAATICAGAAAVAGCSDGGNTDTGGTFTINRVTGLNSVYESGDVVDADLMTLECTDENGDAVTISYREATEAGMTIESVGEYDFGYTDASGNYAFTITYNGATYTFSYQVTSVALTLDFNGGTYNGKDSLQVASDSSGADISLVFTDKIVSPEDGYTFAGWFYDKEGKNRVTITDNVIDASGITVVYACYDKDWSDYYSYEVYDGCATLTSANYKTFSKEEGTQFIIPATIGLYPVTAIADHFAYDGGIKYIFYETYTELVFEEGSKVESIGAEAFESLYFTSINLPESLKKIGESAFANNSQLSGTLTLNKNLVSLGKSAFASCSALEAVDAVEGCALTEIGKSAFSNCQNIVSVTFPDKLTTIGESVFEYCNNITTLHIPASVTNIALGAFSSMGKLESITVDENSANYVTLDGDLYMVDDTKLSLYRYCYGHGNRKTYTALTDCSLPSGKKASVTSIENGAFSLDGDSADDISLKNIYLTGVTSISESAFKNCSAQVWLSDSVTTIAAGAFSGYDGDKIKICDSNKKEKTYTSHFSVDEDGVLYNSDKTELVCILETYNKDTYTLPSSVETICSGAMMFNNNYDGDKYLGNIYLFVIPENSNLKTIEANAIQIGSMNSLCGIYCYKDEPFTLEDGAFDSDNNFGSPHLYVKSSVYEAYKKAWANYVGYLSTYSYYQATKEPIDISYILSTPEADAAEAVSSVEATGFTSYAIFKKGVSGIPAYSYSDHSTTYYNTFCKVLAACIMLDADNEYADYLYSYAASYIKLSEDYYSTGYINSAIYVWGANTDETKNAAVSKYLEEALRYKNGTTDNSDPKVTALNDYFKDYIYDAATFSADDFEKYYAKMHSADAIDLGMYYALDNDVAVNYMKGETSYLIAKLKALGDIDVAHYAEAYEMCYGDGEALAGVDSLIYQLYYRYGEIELDDYYEYICDDTIIAGYSDYSTIKNTLFGSLYYDFIASAVKYVKDFELTSVYDGEKYDEFIDLFRFINNNSMIYDWVTALGKEKICAKYNAMLCSWNIHDFLENYTSYTDASKDSESQTIYDMITYDGVYYLNNYDYPSGCTTDNITEYEGWIIAREDFIAVYKELQAGFDNAVTALRTKLDEYIIEGEFNYDNLTDEAYAEILELEKKAQPHILSLDTEDCSYSEYLTGIELWNRLKALKAAYPAASEVTDLTGLYKLLYSYYDEENEEYVNGLDYYYGLGLTYGLETYGEYTALFTA